MVSLRVGNGTDCGRITAADGAGVEHAGTAADGQHAVKADSRVRKVQQNRYRIMQQACSRVLTNRIAGLFSLDCRSFLPLSL